MPDKQRTPATKKSPDELSKSEDLVALDPNDPLFVALEGPES